MSAFPDNWLVVSALVVAAPVSQGYAVEYLSVAEAQKAAFPAAQLFKDTALALDQAKQEAVAKRLGKPLAGPLPQIWEARAGDVLLGYLAVDHVIGKHLAIDYAVALTPALAVQQVEILTYRESYGGEVRQPDWRKQFAGKTVAAPLRLNDDIVNIGGATLSCRHVTEGVRKILAICDAGLASK